MIEGIPEGYELLAIRKARFEEDYIDNYGKVHKWLKNEESLRIHPVVRKIEKPKRWRPFANAEEFKPHRDRWVKRVDLQGAFLPLGYDNSTVWSADDFDSYQALFDDGHVFDDDGTPFGVEVKE